jgi:hypothetical protein
MSWSTISPKEYHVEQDVSVLPSLFLEKPSERQLMSSLREMAKIKTYWR